METRKKILIMATVFFLSIFFFIEEVKGTVMRYQSLDEVPQSIWEALAAKKIYFGHQSVGENIIEGIQEIVGEDSRLSLSIKETSMAQDYSTPVFGHSKVGKNRFPQLKIDGFAANLQRGLGEETDIAFMKLCYVDAYEETDVSVIFEHYKKILEQLKKAFPDTIFVHFTMPVMVQEKGIKSSIKRMLGKHVHGYEDNLRREQYNEMIRDAYADSEPVFDLARVESTRPDGSREEYEMDGQTYYALVPEYTTDGGHLNKEGRRVVAEHLLLFLATLVSQE
jgi:hypothetical protein